MATPPYHRLDERFTYHAPTGDQPNRYEQIRAAGKELAQALIDRAPSSPELIMAINHVDQAVMWANAAIARNE